MFRGSQQAKVDEKGRLKLPSDFKKLVDAENVTQFYITSVDGEFAEIWPLPEWEKREKHLNESSTMDDAVQTYLTWTSYYGHQVEIDNQARVLLPQLLREEARLDAEVMVVGKLNYLEVHNHDLLKQSMAAKKMTDEHRKSLALLFRQQR
jgi:transcriptional regulator MraZ